MNSLVGLFPTYAALFDHFGKVAEQKSYTVSRYGRRCLFRQKTETERRVNLCLFYLARIKDD